MAQQRKRPSFFEDKRLHDPNFIRSRDCMNDVKNNIRTIIKDVYFDQILDQDYIYFTNDNILWSLIQTSYENYKNNELIVNAMNLYLNELNMNRSPFSANILEERMRCSNLQIKANRLAIAWSMVHQQLQYIRMGADPKASLQYIRGLSKEDLLNM